MYKDYLQNIDGVEVYAIVAMLIFILFFTGILIWLFKVNKQYIRKMENLPLESDSNILLNKTGINQFDKITGGVNEK